MRAEYTALVVLWILHVSLGYWDQGHMVVSQIGFESISNPSARDRYNTLMSALRFAYPNASSSLHAGAWMDDIKHEVPYFNNWHYKDGPIYADDYSGPRNKQPPPHNLVWAINTSMTSLKSSATTELEKAIALRVLIHLLGDLHQPLHNAERYSSAHPSGDRGGNSVRVIDPQTGQLVKLHAFWDYCDGIFEDSPYCCFPNSVRDTAFDEYLSTRVDQIKHAAGCAHNTTEQLEAPIDVEAWHLEGYHLAERVVYPSIEEGANLTSAYVATARKLSECQLGLGGRRLGRLFDSVLSIPSESAGHHAGPDTTAPKRTTFGIVLAAMLFWLLS